MSVNDVENEIRQNPEMYASNAHGHPDAKRAGDEPKKKNAVIKGGAKLKKKSEVRKLTDVFIAEDTNTVKSHIFNDVIVPNVKNLLFETIKTAAEMMLFGEVRRDKNRSGSKVSYRSYYENNSGRRDSGAPRMRSGIDFEDIEFETRSDAQSVLDTMIDIVDQYGVISVGDMYDLAGITTTNYAIQKYGWKNIRGSRVVRIPNGTYVIDLPKAEPIK